MRVILTNAAFGAVAGALATLGLLLTDTLGILSLLLRDRDPLWPTVAFFTLVMATFAAGAVSTGLILDSDADHRDGH